MEASAARKKLKRWMKDTGMSASALARAAKVDPGLISKILRGLREPGKRTLYGIERATDGHVRMQEWVEAVWERRASRPAPSISTAA